MDHRVFWYTNYATPVIWIIFMIINVLSFSISNSTVCLFAAGLAYVNLTNYIKCEKNHKEKVKGFLLQQAQSNLSPEQLLKIGALAVKMN